MASIKEFTNKQGKRRWRVHYVENGTTRHPEFRMFEEACHRLYLEERRNLSSMKILEFLSLRDFTVRWAIHYWLGWRWEKVRTGHLKEASWHCSCREVLAVPELFLATRVGKVRDDVVSGSTSERSLIWISSVFNLLKKLELVPKNPCPKLPKRRRAKVIPPRREEVQRVFDLAGSPPERMFVFLCAVLGLRTSEALAVRRSDVRGSHVHVRQHMTAAGIASGTKSNAGRVIPAPPALLQLLGESDPSAEYLVYSERKPAEPVKLQSFRAHRLKPLYEKAGVSFSNHALRHFAAANWLAKGVNIRDLQELLGHSDIMTTMKVYGHLSDLPDAVENTLKI